MELEVQLGQYIKTQKGYAFKSKWYSDDGHPVVKVSDFTNDSIDIKNLVLIPQKIANEYIKYELNTGDVIIQTVGSWPSNPASVVGKAIRVPSKASGALLNQNAVKIDSDDLLDKGFLYYLLRDDTFKEYIVGTAQGAASQASITLDSIRAFKFICPPLQDQINIASVLASYDNLIENNNRRIAILEDMAQSLYREWFVKFHFPGYQNSKFKESSLGLIPEGWEVKRLDDFVVLQRGFDLPKKKRNEDGGVPIYASSGICGFHDVVKVKGPGIVTGRSGTLGIVTLIIEDFWALNTTLWVKEFKSCSAYYGYYLLSSIGLKNYNSGAAVPTLNRNYIHGLPVISPENKFIEKFEKYVNSNFKAIDLLKRKNDVLRSQRDFLLPKLISGKITLRDDKK